MLLHHVYKTNVNKEEFKKQWSFKAFGNFKEINCMNVNFLLTVSLYLSNPCKRMSSNISSFRFLIETSVLSQLFRSLFLFSAKSWQCKKRWSVVSVSEPQSYTGLGASLNLWRNLCWFKWLNFKRSLDNNLTPTGSWIA